MGSTCCKNIVHRTKAPIPPPDLPPPDPGAPWPGDTFRRAPAERAPAAEIHVALPSAEEPLSPSLSSPDKVAPCTSRSQTSEGLSAAATAGTPPVGASSCGSAQAIAGAWPGEAESTPGGRRDPGGGANAGGKEGAETSSRAARIRSAIVTAGSASSSSARRGLRARFARSAGDRERGREEGSGPTAPFPEDEAAPRRGSRFGGRQGETPTGGARKRHFRLFHRGGDVQWREKAGADRARHSTDEGSLQSLDTAAGVNGDEHLLVSYPPPELAAASARPSDGGKRAKKAGGGGKRRGQDAEGEERARGVSEAVASQRTSSVFARFRRSLRRTREGDRGRASSGSPSPRGKGTGWKETDGPVKRKGKAEEGGKGGGGGGKSGREELRKTTSTGSTVVGDEETFRRLSAPPEDQAVARLGRQSLHGSSNNTSRFVSPDSDFTTTAGSPLSTRGVEDGEEEARGARGAEKESSAQAAAQTPEKNCETKRSGDDSWA
ncbi:hypothetical protein BESB_048570 [Besnoitia besnoiti]|uniref:Uncharacterized protein n=1 Tax=Besnoitia besnoiti TaxID=94643 RepID=A0A2A9MFB2_BESBE|nr:hypothetical protein BESB_048570 [Besnoitia besnoiti]PFH36665.1 hypothetical protein BESB_048570 [Besnoitia besnoiti]